MSDLAKQEVGRLLAALPSTVNVDGLVIDIVVSHEIKEGDAWGVYRGYTQTIKIATDIPTPERLGLVLLHELLHAAYYYRDIVDNNKVSVDTEERLVDTTSTAILALFAYNLWLLPWLHTCLTWRNKDDGDRRLDKLLTGFPPVEIRNNRPPKFPDTRDRAGGVGKAQGRVEDGGGPEVLNYGEDTTSPER